MNGSFLRCMNVLVVNMIVVDHLLVVAPHKCGGAYDILGNCQQLFLQQPSAVVPNLVFFLPSYSNLAQMFTLLVSKRFAHLLHFSSAGWPPCLGLT